MGIKTWVIFISLTTTASSQYSGHSCSTTGNYTRESLYRADLNALLASLSSTNATFYNASAGQANAAALCRPDIQPTTCRGCVKIAAADVLAQCPDQLEAVEARAALLDDLRSRAAAGGSVLKAAAGSRAAGGSNQTVFGLVQCSPDLSAENCSRCLAEAAAVIPACCDALVGVRVYTPSCTIRYELSDFYNETRLQELIAASPPPIAGSDGDANKIRNIVIIVVSIVSFLTLAFFLRKKTKKHETTEDPNVESIQYEFHKIKAATNNFSDANALGRGGFGIVYKGKLENGKEIAVKRLSRDLGQGEGEFKNEVLLVARLQHRNLVRLLGFSTQGIERLLVYEFVPNGSLDNFLYGALPNS
ncbi:cysteine-rich receptor-like protein kinase 25 [Salvia miltiorrhiza]|uniref:cysteine-rich receptor-like protein kinase 25 n=1 Tax=Salvia miltiorrhiza TaxID=226208 RepID=UPI0025AD6CF8|nr:cysteine-rich receptor-like protein kinase 25 [Salvia miltiorrhiza]